MYFTRGSRKLGDLSLKIDGQVLTPRLVSTRFPAIQEMKEGRGEIQIEFAADLPSGGPNRKLTFGKSSRNPHRGVSGKLSRLARSRSSNTPAETKLLSIVV
jgi:hypothetical protein